MQIVFREKSPKVEPGFEPAARAVSQLACVKVTTNLLLVNINESWRAFVSVNNLQNVPQQVLPMTNHN